MTDKPEGIEIEATEQTRDALGIAMQPTADQLVAEKSASESPSPSTDSFEDARAEVISDTADRNDDDEAEVTLDELTGEGDTTEKRPQLQSATRAAAVRLQETARAQAQPVAVIETQSLQEEIDYLLDSFSDRFHKSSKEITTRMDDVLRRMDELERKLH
ncbi:hypothetical protein V1512DRAFT_290003 [Lipomyces arxii]|uniref:uncharacterized protein n=1 Tax=Lipomyces arxii TaxID=56418 RepID=UPI0034CEC834